MAKKLEDLTRKQAKKKLDEGGTFTLSKEAASQPGAHPPGAEARASEESGPGYRAGAISWAEGYYIVLPEGEAMRAVMHQAVASSYEELTAIMARIAPFEEWSVDE